ncbi:MAG: T9SS type A sorting domain-containing protein, partial [Bacteroidetes bacterium]|nr:T9SS type A sorting domain-containing protein [Bacteroidota bacterium]
TFTANTGILDQETLIFDPIVIASVGTLSAEIVSVNDGANYITAKASADIVAAPAKYTKQSIVLNLRTDANPKDIYWYVTDDSGNELAHGGNNAVGPNGGALYPGGSPDSPSAYPANTLVKDTFDVPVNSCFTLTVVDGAGDGIIPPGLIRLFDLGSTSPFYTKIGATAAGYDAHTFAPKTSGTAEATEISSFAVYPNPAADVLNITYTLDAASDCHLTVSNATGQLVRSQFSIPQALGQNQHQLSLEGLANGMYFLNMQTASGIKSVRFVVAR